MDEVDRLAEMERQRRVREAEQKVSKLVCSQELSIITLDFDINQYLCYCECSLIIISEFSSKVVEEEAAKRIELLVKKRVEEELEKRKDEIEQEVAKRVEEAKRKMEKEMMEELERQREQQRRKEMARQVTALFLSQSCAKAIHRYVALTHDEKMKCENKAACSRIF